MKYSVKIYPDIKQKVENMSVEELLRAVICPDVSCDELPEKKPGSVFFYSTTAEKAHKASMAMNKGNSEPALIVSDMEYGAANVIFGATVFPSMRAAAETGESALAYDMGVIAAREAINAGYHWTFGPCVDLLGNPYSPAVAYRTAGADPDSVIEYCGAYMEGLQDNGLIATLKHFPGDGYCVEDQHVTTAENPLSKEDWDKTFGKVYSNLINRGAMAIMPGHISLPAYDNPDENGLYPPATVSKRLLTDLLRGELGFEGIIVSDAANMGGFCGYLNFYRACAAFLEAGGDCLLFVHETEDFVSGMENCIKEGYLSLETLKDRACRMKSFAREYFEKHPVGERALLDSVWAEDIARRISERAVKVVRNRNSLIPFNITSETKIANVVICNVWADISLANELGEKLAQIAAKVDTRRDVGPGALLSMAKSGQYDLIVCSVFEAPSWGINTSKLCGPAARNMMNGWMRYNTPVIFVSYSSESFGRTYKASVDTLIETYGITKYTAERVIKLIRGE